MGAAKIGEARLTNVVLQTTDLERQAAFYEGVVGCEPFFRNETCVFLRTGATHLVFVRGDQPSTGACLDFAVADLEVARQGLAEAGIAFREETPGVLVLSDPDGNTVEIVRG